MWQPTNRQPKMGVKIYAPPIKTDLYFWDVFWDMLFLKIEKVLKNIIFFFHPPKAMFLLWIDGSLEDGKVCRIPEGIMIGYIDERGNTHLQDKEATSAYLCVYVPRGKEFTLFAINQQGNEIHLTDMGEHHKLGYDVYPSIYCI